MVCAQRVTARCHVLIFFLLLFLTGTISSGCLMTMVLQGFNVATHMTDLYILFTYNYCVIFLFICIKHFEVCVWMTCLIAVQI